MPCAHSNVSCSALGGAFFGHQLVFEVAYGHIPAHYRPDREKGKNALKGTAHHNNVCYNRATTGNMADTTCEQSSTQRERTLPNNSL